MHWLRTPISYSADLAKDAVDREARTVKGCAVITRGPALGHGFWIDSTFLAQVAAASALREEGLKCRVGHPGLSADAFGDYLGRIANCRLDGDRVIGDLRCGKSAKEEYVRQVLERADEDPKAFGTSIVFAMDGDAVERFRADNVIKQGKDEVFISPDPLNVDNLLHARLKDIHACDVVDSPAANANGFLSEGDEVASRAEAICQFAFGISDIPPDEFALGNLPPEKLRIFFSNFVERHRDALASKFLPLLVPSFTAIEPGELVSGLAPAEISLSDETIDKIADRVAESLAGVSAPSLDVDMLREAVRRLEAEQTCGSCGATFTPDDSGDRQCPECGADVPDVATSTPSTPPTPPAVEVPVAVEPPPPAGLSEGDVLAMFAKTFDKIESDFTAVTGRLD